MSASDSFQRDSQQSAGLSLNLSSNNPFRNRAASPASPFDDPPSARPVSRNPFLDAGAPPLKSPDSMSSNPEHKSLSAEEIFNSLTLDERRTGEKSSMGNNQQLLLDLSPEKPAPSQRPDDAAKNRRMPPPGSGPRPGPPASPTRRAPPPQQQQQRRPRRNSDSSVLDFDAAPLTEEEKRMIAKRRERERRQRESRAAAEPREDRDVKKEDGDKAAEARKDRDKREGKPRSSKPVRPSRRMDIIDQLDATSIYGTGLFHHDGPFDALNPNRNRNKSRRAPMHAFPEDSLNNSLGGGPVPKQADHTTFLGQGGVEAFQDYSYKAKDRNGYNHPQAANGGAPIFDPVARGDIVHGDESVGLGTSTFLEGTPAARTAIAKHHKEQSQEFLENNLQRKKSLAQRIRHINKGPRDYGAGGRMVGTPDSAFSNTRSPEYAGAGGESNPFFSEYSKGEDSLTVRPRDESNKAPRRGSGGQLERRATTDATGAEEASKPSGLLGRMKSLKGGRKPRNVDPASPPGQPGTAI